MRVAFKTRKQQDANVIGIDLSCVSYLFKERTNDLEPFLFFIIQVRRNVGYKVPRCTETLLHGLKVTLGVQFAQVVYMS